MKGPISRMFGRGAGCAFVVLLGFAVESQAQVYTLTDGNSVAKINYNGPGGGNPGGMFYWGVQNTPATIQNQLFQQWFWYRVGNTDPEKPIDTLSPAALTGLGPNHVTTTYTDGPGRFNVGVTYTLQGGQFTSGNADITEQIVINNTSGGVLPFHFFQYSDFNLGGDGANDFILLSRNGFTSRFNQTDQLDGANIVETTATPNANHGEADLVPNTFTKLTDGFPTTLDDSKTNAFGDVAWALE